MSARTTIAQITDALLGGREAYQEARDAAKLLDTIPGYTSAVSEERGFMARAVTHAATNGVLQFLQVGCGYPSEPNMHETAWMTKADIKAAYVSPDPVVVAHTRVWLDRFWASSIIAAEADMTSPATVVDQVKGTIDFGDRVCLIMNGLHHLPGSLASNTVHAWKAVLARGSYMVLSQAASNLKSSEIARGRSAYGGAGARFCPRAPSTVRTYFNGIQMTDPGLDAKTTAGVVSVTEWGLALPDRPARPVIIGGVGVKK